MSNPLQKAIELAGGKIAMGLAMGLDRTAIYKWGDECPSDRVLAVCELVNWEVTPHELRPDLYPNKYDAMPLEAA